MLTTELVHEEKDLQEIYALRVQSFRHCGFDLTVGDGTGKDSLDAIADHLALRDTDTGKIVGAYRFIPGDRMGTLYSEEKFFLPTFYHENKAEMCDLGRAVLSPKYRSRGMLLLFKGLANYMVENNLRYFLGSPIVKNQGAERIRGLENYFHERDILASEEHLAVPKPELTPPFAQPTFNEEDVPALLNMYLRFGSKIASPPVIDHDMNAYAFLIFFDKEHGTPKSDRFFQDK